MSLLHQEEHDDAAQGESLTRGTSHVVWAAIASAAVMITAIAIYVISNQKPPIATGEVVAVWAHPQHTDTTGVDASGAPKAKESFDQVMIFAKIRLHNQADHPITLSNVTTNVTLDDGIHSSYAAAKGDYNRVFVAYPDIPVPHGEAISPLDTTIAPGQTAEGEILSAFMMTKQQWDAHKKLDFTFSFRYQPNLVVAPQVAIIEQ
jgi:hypothetical protein